MAAALLVVGLITLGGVVRITGSGLGCGDHWPLCDGQWFPPLDLTTLIEISHRWVAGLVTVAVFALAVSRVAPPPPDQPALRRPAVVAAVLLVIQVLLGPVIVEARPPTRRRHRPPAQRDGVAGRAGGGGAGWQTARRLGPAVG